MRFIKVFTVFAGTTESGKLFQFPSSNNSVCNNRIYEYQTVLAIGIFYFLNHKLLSTCLLVKLSTNWLLYHHIYHWRSYISEDYNSKLPVNTTVSILFVDCGNGIYSFQSFVKIQQQKMQSHASRSNMTVPLFDLDDPMTHPSGPLFQF